MHSKLLSLTCARLIATPLLLLLCWLTATAQNLFSGYVGQGGNSVVIVNTNSTTKVQKSFPGATVTVYRPGTSKLVSTRSDSSLSTMKANPLTPDTTGYDSFYTATAGPFDLRFSGTGITTPSRRGRDGSTIMGSADYASLSAAVAAFGSTVTTLVINSALPSGASTTVPSTLRLEFAPGGSIVLGPGHTVTINSDTKEWPVAQIFSGTGTATLSGASILHPEWFGAIADNSTDSASAFNKTCTAALNGNHNKLIQLAAGRYVIGSQVTCGSSNRTIGLTIQGTAKYASQLRWTGNTSDTVLKVWNVQHSLVKDFSIVGTTVPGIALWYAVDDGKAGSGPVTERLYISNASVGMQIGGGSTTSSGQANSGEHTSVSFDSCVTGVKITGANTEVQNFYNLTMGGSAMTRGFHLLNGRGLYIKGADISLNNLSYHIPFFVEVEGSGLAHGGGYTFEDMRLEAMAGFFYGHPDNPGLPLTLSLKNVSAAAPPVGSSAPHDVIKLDTGSWTVTVRDSIFLAPESRFSFLNLNSDRYVSFLLENCMINHGWTAMSSPPDNNPYLLINATRQGSGTADDGGVRSVLRGNLLTVTSGVYQPRIRMKDRVILMAESDIAAGTYRIINENDNAGMSIGTVSTAVKNLLHGSVTFTGGATKPVTFTSALPSTTYRVLVTGNANETFWITGKAATGFTINSSNAKSTATVDWEVIR